MTIKRGGRGLFILKPRRDWSCFLLPALLLLEQGLGFSSMQRLVRRRCELCQLRWCSDGMHPITKMITRASFPAVSSIREEACVHRLRARRRVVLLLASPPKAAGEEKRDDAYGRECRDNIEFSSTKAAKEGPERNSTMAALPQDTWAPFPMPNRAGIETFIKSPLTELGLSFLVSLSCFLFALQTCDGMMGGQPGGVDLGEPMLSFIDRTEYCIGIVFVVEYIMRWYYQGLSFRYLLSPLMAIDLVAVLPTVLRLLSIPLGFGGFSLEFLRLLRVLRFQRFLNNGASFERTFGPIWAGAGSVKKWQLEVARILSSIITLVFVASGLMYEAEKNVNPAFSDFFAALYFGLTTLTTVGFGDIYPITPTGRAVVGLSILFGITIIPVQLSNLANAIINDSQLLPSSSVSSSSSLQRVDFPTTNSDTELYGKDRRMSSGKNQIAITRKSAIADSIESDTEEPLLNEKDVAVAAVLAKALESSESIMIAVDAAPQAERMDGRKQPIGKQVEQKPENKRLLAADEYSVPVAEARHALIQSLSEALAVDETAATSIFVAAEAFADMKSMYVAEDKKQKEAGTKGG